MTDKEQVAMKLAASATAAAGGWLSYESVTAGFNLFTAICAGIAGALAVVWWLIRIRNEIRNGQKEPEK